MSRIVCLPLLLLAIGCSDKPSDATSDPNGPGPHNGSDASTEEDGGQLGADGGVKAKALLTPSHGSAVAVSDDDAHVVVVNRDVGTVSIFAVDWTSDALPTLTKSAELAVGAEPWQVVIHPNGNTAFVLVRKDQKLVRIDDLATTPKVGPSVAVGSEPTGVALTPTGQVAWVANQIDGTLMGVATATMTIDSTVDLNATIAASGLLGPSLAGRPSLAHPRAIAITNNGDMVDADESIFVTDFFAIQKDELLADGSNVNTSKVGVVYKVPLATKKASIIELPPMLDMGFQDVNGQTVGCFPNQLGGIVIQGGFGYVTSVCASPKGPIGMSTGPALAACTSDATCPGAGVGSCVSAKCKTNCTTDVQCGVVGGKCTANLCEANPANIRKLAAPAISIIDLGGAKTIATVNLSKEFHAKYEADGAPDDATRRLPLAPSDIGFVPGTVMAYFPSSGTDAMFKVDFNATYAASTIDGLGDPKAPFINLAPAGVDPSKVGRVPAGVAIAHKLHKEGSEARYAFVANDATRNLSVVDLAKQQVAGLSDGTPVVAQSTPMPTDAKALAELDGKRLFLTGLGRWSWKGQGWGACTTCHGDGLSDNVTWYLGSGPGQSPTFEALYSKKDPSEYRVNLWRAKLDEPSDHEGAIRSIVGGVGAIVADQALNFSSRMTFDSGLNGSSLAAADPANPAHLATACVIDDWQRIVSWMKVVRSPRHPTNLVPEKVTAGKAAYLEGGCQGCHGGSRWTISHVFYTPDLTGVMNAKLKTLSWTNAVTNAGFPTTLFPAVTPAAQTMRYSGTNAGLDQLTCMLRPVGTYGVGEPGMGVLEVKGSDMKTASQGNEPDGKGFNTPSLLGVQLGAPFLHAGQVRTLEALFSDTFAPHLRAINPTFLDANDPARADKLANLVQYVLSIDEDAEPVAVPALGPAGGDFCAAQ